ncbi:MAG TPA: hypothetical protein VN375_19280 [Vicinamibacteria bacterium]|jgi:hypothetical protein|nr:hypothetical protein [Vicinamibacteria bacterium]
MLPEVIIIADDEPTVDPAHEAQMEELAEAVQEAEVVALAAFAAATDDTHVCRCDEIEAALTVRLVALEAAEVEAAAVEDLEIEAAMADLETEVVEEELEPAPPVKKSKAEPEADDAESKPKAGRSGVSKGWFGNRAK